jgi:hypothetical protein
VDSLVAPFRLTIPRAESRHRERLYWEYDQIAAMATACLLCGITRSGKPVVAALLRDRQPFAVVVETNYNLL